MSRLPVLLLAITLLTHTTGAAQALHRLQHFSSSAHAHPDDVESHATGGTQYDDCCEHDQTPRHVADDDTEAHAAASFVAVDDDAAHDETCATCHNVAPPRGMVHAPPAGVAVASVVPTETFGPSSLIGREAPRHAHCRGPPVA